MDSADLQKNYMDGYNKLMEAYRGSGIRETVDTMNRAIHDSDNEGGLWIPPADTALESEGYGFGRCPCIT